MSACFCIAMLTIRFLYAWIFRPCNDCAQWSVVHILHVVMSECWYIFFCFLCYKVSYFAFLLRARKAQKSGKHRSRVYLLVALIWQNIKMLSQLIILVIHEQNLLIERWVVLYFFKDSRASDIGECARGKCSVSQWHIVLPRGRPFFAHLKSRLSLALLSLTKISGYS